MKNLSTTIGLVALLAGMAGCTSGCSTPNTPTVSPAVVQMGVQTLVAYGVAKYPTVTPYLGAAAPFICSAAQGTNSLDPAAITAAIEASPLADKLKTPEAVLILNSALTLYVGIWDSYGTNVNLTAMQPYLQATCSGITSSLPPALAALRSAGSAKWPMVKF